MHIIIRMVNVAVLQTLYSRHAIFSETILEISGPPAERVLAIYIPVDTVLYVSHSIPT
jgi:hypothetical protein